MTRRTDQAPSIRRALELHQGRGIVRGFRSLTEPGRPRCWVVAAEGIGTQQFTDAEVMAFCLGLAAAHHREARTAAVLATMTPAQTAALLALCERYSVQFDPSDYAPQFDLPEGYVAGWVGGGQDTIYVGVSPDGDVHT